LDTHFSREHSITKNWTINSFNAEILSWASKEQREAKMLYEMKLDLRKALAEEEKLGDVANKYFGESRESDNFCCAILYEDLESDPSGKKPTRTMVPEICFLSRHPSKQHYIEKGGEMFMELVDQDRSVAAGYVTVLRDIKSSPSRLYISSLSLKPEYRGKGIGKWFMRYIITMALGITVELEERKQDRMEHHGQSDWKVDEVWLTVFCENVAAVNLYASLGFKVNRCLWTVGNKEE
jgi:ribosomal protein S18 acetylase RimI-like enzyme